MKTLLSSIPILILLPAIVVDAQQQQCSEALFRPVPSPPSTDVFTSIVVPADCPTDDGDYIIPSSLPVHITELTSSSTTNTTTTTADVISISIVPVGVVIPKVVNNELRFAWGTDYTETDEVGIEIVVPPNKVSKITIPYPGSLVEMSLQSPVEIVSRDAGGSLYIRSVSPVKLKQIGSDSKVEIEAPMVNLDSAGTGLQIRVKGNVTGSISGSGADILVEGSADSLVVAGTGIAIRVNGGSCSRIVQTPGLGITCDDTTTDAVTVSDMACTAQGDETKNLSCNKGVQIISDSKSAATRMHTFFWR